VRHNASTSNLPLINICCCCVFKHVLIFHARGLQSQLKSGDYFGEHSLLFCSPHRSNAFALTLCDVYRLDRKDYIKIVAHFDGYYELHRRRWPQLEQFASMNTVLIPAAGSGISLQDGGRMPARPPLPASSRLARFSIACSAGAVKVARFFKSLGRHVQSKIAQLRAAAALFGAPAQSSQASQKTYLIELGASKSETSPPARLAV
jgi:hypothetical protein